MSSVQKDSRCSPILPSGHGMTALNGREHGKYGCVRAAAPGMCSPADLDGLRAASYCSGTREAQPQWVHQWSELTGVEMSTAWAVQQGCGGAGNAIVVGHRFDVPPCTYNLCSEQDTSRSTPRHDHMGVRVKPPILYAVRKKQE